MSVEAAHVLYAVNINAASDVLIDQISDQNLDAGLMEMILGGAGEVYNRFVAVQGQAPRVGFATSKIKTALDKCGAAGLALDADNILEMFFQAVAEGGTREGVTSHLKLSVNEGLLVPRTIEAPHGGRAVLTYEGIATWDGTNDPVVLLANQTLPGTPAVDEVFTAGPVEINGVALTAIQNISIAFGISEMVVGGDGEVWPSFVAIQGIQPIITITTLDVLVLNTLDLEGKAQTASDSVVYLRKIAKGGTRVPEATEQHISFTIDEGRIATRTVGGSHGVPLAAIVQITPTYDGTHAPVAVDTTAAIA